MHTRTASIRSLTGWAGALLSLLVSCTPNPRFTAAHYQPPEMHRTTGADEAPLPQPQESDTAATAVQSVASPKKADSQPQSRSPAADTARLQSSWSSAFDAEAEKPAQPLFVESCRAVWYGPGFNGKKTACGERFDMNECTAAHRSLPFNSTVKVTNLGNGMSVIARVNDRGPFDKKYCIDLSLGAAKKIGLDKTGTAEVRVETVRER